MIGPKVKVHIQRMQSTTADDYGSYTKTWDHVISLNGTLVPLSIREQSLYDRNAVAADHRLYLDWIRVKDVIEHIKASGRVRTHHQNYEILSVTPYHDKHIVLDLRLTT